MPQPNAMQCLVVDDEPRLRRVLVRLLEGDGFTCREAGSGVEAIALLEHERIPLVLSDLRMPQMDGVSLLREVVSRWPDTAVVMITAVAEVESAVACLQLGAMDYVAKPFHLDEVRARVMQALDKRRLVMENRDYQVHLEERVQQQAGRIEELFLGGVQALAQALEAKDPYLKGHSLRVAEYAVAIAAELGLPEETRRTIDLGGHLHDIGKIGVSEEVLHKSSRLTELEYNHVMEHPVIGARILGPLLDDAPTVIAIVRSHHERLDGKGLPDGLAGEAIPTEVRVVSVADAFDAMTSVRPYRPSLSVERALEELSAGKGRQFDPGAVDAFLHAFPESRRLPIPTPERQVLRPSGARSVRRA